MESATDFSAQKKISKDFFQFQRLISYWTLCRTSQGVFELVSNQSRSSCLSNFEITCMVTP